MTEQRSFMVDDDLFDAGLDGYVKTGGVGRNIYRLKAGEPKKGYFFSDPTPETRKSGEDWLSYREISAFDGLRGGVDLPNGMKEFPVYDQKVVQDPETGQRKVVSYCPNPETGEVEREDVPNRREAGD